MKYSIGLITKSVKALFIKALQNNVIVIHSMHGWLVQVGLHAIGPA